jgi:hypothetical protein
MSFFAHRATVYSGWEIAFWVFIGAANVAAGLIFDSALSLVVGTVSLACWGAVGWVKLWAED